MNLPVNKRKNTIENIRRTVSKHKNRDKRIDIWKAQMYHTEVTHVENRPPSSIHLGFKSREETSLRAKEDTGLRSKEETLLKSDFDEHKNILDSLGSVNLQKASRTSELLMHNQFRLIPTNVTSNENFDDSKQHKGSHVFGKADPMILKDHDEVEICTDQTNINQSKEALLNAVRKSQAIRPQTALAQNRPLSSQVYRSGQDNLHQ